MQIEKLLMIVSVVLHPALAFRAGFLHSQKRETSAEDPLADKTRLLLFDTSSAIEANAVPSIAQTFRLDERFAELLLAAAAFNGTRQTVLYVHGFIESPRSASVQTIVRAYAQRADHNVLVFDWTTLAAGNYLFDAVPNMRRAAARLAEVLFEASQRGFGADQLHVVGHSLGGQLAGLVGRQLHERSNGTLQLRRISALDPANPPFYLDGTFLRAGDARLVDVIHTDAGLFGGPIASGGADFWPNGGATLQPGCEWRNWLQPLSVKSLCSHHRSWRFWAESLVDPRGFPSRAASSWTEFQRRNRIAENQLLGLAEDDEPVDDVDDDDDVVFMGIDCRPESKGSFYLQTNDRQPFARRLPGLRYAGRG